MKIEPMFVCQDTLFTRHKVYGVVAMAVSENNRHIVLYTDTGHLYLGSVDFKDKYCEHYANTKEPLTGITWLVMVVCFSVIVKRNR